ncbi:hypothetical protein DFH07DRAFT_974504 [Mycena maculata]|uniref:Uncharacterized protein n=1 Tax=Mycena maculata TaxID=230809 RepID=A0AAD7H7J9_9AGAR|nr:hypothetical protein DFH07DRAFT_974504 [Mycena maculata]
MATTTTTPYLLRERKDGKVVSKSAVATAESTDSDDDTRKYSDIVAARSVSSALGLPPIGVVPTVIERFISPAGQLEIMSEPAMSVSPPVEEQGKDNNPNPWVTVERKTRRRSSLESLSKLGAAGKTVEFLTSRSPSVTAEQTTAIKAAEGQLTEAEKRKIYWRSHSVKVESDKTSVSSVPEVQPAIAQEVRPASPVPSVGEGSSRR